LAELQGEVAKDAGYASIADMVGGDRQRAEQVALLKLQHEVCAARLVAGGELVTNELIALNDAIARTLPAATARPLTIPDIVLVDGFSFELKRAIDACKDGDDIGRVALAMANDRIAELEAENKAQAKVIEDYEKERQRQEHLLSPRQDPAQPVRRAVGGSDNVLPFSSGTDWSGLAMANSPTSGYLPPDKFDPAGRRLDQDGLPASRRKDREDGAAPVKSLTSACPAPGAHSTPSDAMSEKCQFQT
jgi:hypothetical protein